MLETTWHGGECRTSPKDTIAKAGTASVQAEEAQTETQEGPWMKLRDIASALP